MVLLPRTVFAAALNTSDNHFYIYRLRNDITPEWILTHDKTNSYFTRARMTSSLKLAFLLTMDATTPAYNFRSKTRGDDWQNYGAGFTTYAFRPVTDSLVYACSRYVLYKSTNGGDSWTSLGNFSSLVPTGIPIEILYFEETGGVTRIVIVHDEGDTIHTTNEGGSFSKIASGLGSIEKTLSLLDRVIAFSSYYSAISYDNCVTWETPVLMISGKVFRDAAICQKNHSEIIISADNQVAVTYNGALSWNAGAFSSDGNNIHSLAYDSGFNYFGSNQDNGIFYKIINYAERTDIYQFNEDTNIVPVAFTEIQQVEGIKYNSKTTTQLEKKSQIITEFRTDSTMRINY